MSLLSETAWQRWIRTAKVQALRARRRGQWLLSPRNYPPPQCQTETLPFVIWQENVAITRTDEAAVQAFEHGKRRNLALAARYIDGVVITSERPFSFWRCVPRPSRTLGFLPGMELRAGCIVPAVGGGICLLTNALFRAASHLGWQILERHGHTLAASPDLDALALDATVFWPYVDLRFAPRTGSAQIHTTVRDNGLQLTITSSTPNDLVVDHQVVRQQRSHAQLESDVQRSVRRKDGTLIDEQVVARNRRRVLTVHQQSRNCYSCGETTCSERTRILREVNT